MRVKHLWERAVTGEVRIGGLLARQLIKTLQSLQRNLLEEYGYPISPHSSTAVLMDTSRRRGELLLSTPKIGAPDLGGFSRPLSQRRLLGLCR